MAKVIVFKQAEASLTERYEQLAVTSDESCQQAIEAAKWCKTTRLAIKNHPALSKVYQKATEALDAVKELRNAPMARLEKLEKALRDSVATWNTAKEKQRLLAEAAHTAAAKETVMELMAPAPLDIGDGETYTFDIPEEAATSVLLDHVHVSLPSTAIGSSRRYWKPRITDVKALATAWTQGRIPADVFELREDGTITLLANVTRHAMDLQLRMDWPGVVNDFEDRPYLGAEGA